MTKEDSDEKFSFQIEGKDYIISKKSKPQKKDQDKKKFHMFIIENGEIQKTLKFQKM